MRGKGPPDDLGDALVGPPAVHQQQGGQEPELGQGKVCGHHGLKPLLAADANPNMGRLDHAHCTINSWHDNITSTVTPQKYIENTTAEQEILP